VSSTATKVRAESGSSPEHWDELLVKRTLRLGLIVDVHVDNGGMHEWTSLSFLASVGIWYRR
jgi:hypothetical protein